MSTSTRRLAQGLQKWVMAIPAPLSHTPALETAELQQAARKAQGSWKEMDKEEMVQCKLIIEKVWSEKIKKGEAVLLFRV